MTEAERIEASEGVDPLVIVRKFGNLGRDVLTSPATFAVQEIHQAVPMTTAEPVFFEKGWVLYATGLEIYQALMWYHGNPS